VGRRLFIIVSFVSLLLGVAAMLMSVRSALPFLLIAPLFFSVLIGLSRPKGDRLIAGIGVYITYIMLGAVLFGSLMLVNFLILSALYGPAAVLSGHIWIVRGRTFIELSDGRRYGGVWGALWSLADFIGLAVAVYAVFPAGRWLYSRSASIRRLVCRIDQATNHKLLSR